MVKTIWKYQLESGDKTILSLPKGAEILSFQNQFEEPCFWALVDPNAEKEARTFEVHGTGHDIHYDMGMDRKYLGTCQILDGRLVLHLFEIL